MQSSNVTRNRSGTSEVSINEEMEQIETLRFVIYSLQWVAVVTACGGIAGNVLTYMTASRLGTVSSGTTFIKSLALVDCLAALVNGIIPSGGALLGQKLLILNQYTCKTGRFLAWLSVLWANYILLALSVDRVIAVCKPLTYRLKSKPGIARKTSLFLGIFIGIMCSPTFLTIILEGEDCFTRKKQSTGLLPAKVLDWYPKFMTLIFNLGIPILGHVVLDGIILFQLRGASVTLSRKERDVTVSMLLVCVFYLSTTLVIALTITKYSIMEVSTFSDVLMRRLLILGAETSATINHSMNFVFYLVGSQSFRASFITMITVRPKEQVDAIPSTVPPPKKHKKMIAKVFRRYLN